MSALGFGAFVEITGNPLELRESLEGHGLKPSQIDLSYPLNRWQCIDFIYRGIIFTGQAGIPRVATTDGAAKLPNVSDKEQIETIKYHLRQCLPVEVADSRDWS